MVLRWMFLTILATALAIPLFALPVLAGEPTPTDSSGPVVAIATVDHTDSAAGIDLDLLRCFERWDKPAGKASTESRMIDLLRSLAKRHEGGEEVKSS
jgi:hypothetical protein